LVSASCPSTQPSYSLTNPCTGPAFCSYTTAPHYCLCLVQSGQGVWVCL
jgi:hypothetical protein